MNYCGICIAHDLMNKTDVHVRGSVPMIKFQIICPECRAAVVTAHPEALVCERCPGCGRHIWDRYDTMMAEEVRLDIDRRSVTGPMIN